MTLGRYVVLDTLGAGGMGEVVAAYDPELDRKVAIKALRGSARRRLGKENRARLLHEARAIAKLSDRNVLPVYHVGEFDGELFIAMKLVDGVSIARHCAKLSWERVLPIVLAAGRGLAAAHRAGLVHRDVKPSNMMVDRDGEVYVTDFGLARPSDRGQFESPAVAESDEHDLDDLLLPVTKQGAVIGTPVYMAPEQHQGGVADARADQYSFCIVAWELLFGVYPFDAGSPVGLLGAKRMGPTRTSRARRVPRRIERALLRGLACDPAARHRDMETLLAAMQGHGRRNTVVMAIAGAAAAVGLAVSWPRTEPCSGDERLAAAWDVERRDALAQGLASEVGPRVAAAIDDYATRWRAVYDETCAERSRLGEARYDARMACLGRRVIELGELASVLENADEATAMQASAAVHSWSTAGACEDAGTESAAPAIDAEISRMIARSRALLLAGRWADAVTAANDALEAAQRDGDVHARIEALIVHGDAHIRGGNADVGQSSYEQAVQEAGSAGADEAAARSAIQLMRYHAIAHHVDDAMLWSRHAEGALQRLGAPPRLQAAWLEAEGIARGNRGEFEDSVDAFEQALVLQRELGGEDTLEIAALHNGLGVAYDAQGRWTDAQKEFFASLSTSIRLLGEHHPTVALRLMNLGHVELRLRDGDRAREHFARALAICEETLPPIHPQIGVAARSLAEAELDRSNPRAAEPLARRSLELVGEAYGPNDPRTARSHETLMRVALALGRDEEALEHASAALTIDLEKFGPTHVDTAFAHDSVAEALLALGRHREAQRHYRQALTAAEESLGVAHHDLAHVLDGSVRCELALGDAAAARAAAVRLVAIVEREDGEHLELAQAHGLLAATELASG
ncbi:MAG TPA: serine/threonine-protein kinase, partial [Nannocystaceae bacterium]|nr:serine/threonine-protein kinase [Nannocystaceae bacterium]